MMLNSVYCIKKLITVRLIVVHGRSYYFRLSHALHIDFILDSFPIDE